MSQQSQYGATGLGNSSRNVYLEGEGKDAKNNASFVHAFSLWLQPEGATTLRVDVSASSNLLKKFPFTF